MKEIFEKLSERLMGVPGMRWVDMDYGQLDYYTLRPEVAFPATLVKISYPQCEDISEMQQLVKVAIRLRVAFQPLGETYSTAPTEVKERALGMFNTLDELHELLQGWTGDGSFSALSRHSVVPEDRRDGYTMYALTYGSAFTDEELYS